MDEIKEAIDEICDVIKDVSMARIEDGHLEETPIDQVQDAINVIQEEFSEYPEELEDTEETVILTLIKGGKDTS